MTGFHLIPLAEAPVSRWLDRLIALLFVVAAAALIWTLAGVDPDERGFGTHEQLGMQPCGWMQGESGIPCPTCGVTTAATHLIHLQPFQSFRTQPFGFGLTLGGLYLAAMAAWCLLRRYSFLYFLVWLPLGTIFASTVGLLLAAWLYKYLMI